MANIIQTDYGKDILIGKVVSTESGLKNLMNALVRRLSTPLGGLFYDPDYGLDVRSFLNGEINQNSIDTIRVSVEQELEKDERVRTCRCDLQFTESTFALRLNIQVTPYIGKVFTLVVSVDKLSVKLLEDALNSV